MSTQNPFRKKFANQTDGWLLKSFASRFDFSPEAVSAIETLIGERGLTDQKNEILAREKELEAEVLNALPDDPAPPPFHHPGNRAVSSKSTSKGPENYFRGYVQTHASKAPRTVLIVVGVLGLTAPITLFLAGEGGDLWPVALILALIGLVSLGISLVLKLAGKQRLEVQKTSFGTPEIRISGGRKKLAYSWPFEYSFFCERIAKQAGRGQVVFDRLHFVLKEKGRVKLHIHEDLPITEAPPTNWKSGAFKTGDFMGRASFWGAGVKGPNLRKFRQVLEEVSEKK